MMMLKEPQSDDVELKPWVTISDLYLLSSLYIFND